MAVNTVWVVDMEGQTKGEHESSELKVHRIWWYVTDLKIIMSSHKRGK